MSFLNAHPNFRSALRVFVYAFIAGFVPSLLGFLGDVLDWTQQDGAIFPDVTVLGKALVAAFVAALAGLIAYVYNKLPIGTAATYIDTTAREG
jgi:apolipoprotein N-acyltransferase